MSAEVETTVLNVSSGLDSSDDTLVRSRDPVHRRPMNFPPAVHNKKHKMEETRHFKFCRKRSQSFTGNKVFLPYKKRKKEKLVPPTKFLLGGNIHDPLNLNSLQDEEVNRAMNAVTPKSSPMPTPKHLKGEVEVIIPPNIHDPLNLAGNEEDEEYEARLTNPPHKKVKKKNKKKKPKVTSGSGKEDGDAKSDESKTEETIEQENNVAVSAPEPITKPEVVEEKKKEVTKPVHLDISTTPQKDSKKVKKDDKDFSQRTGGRKFDSKDKIVSPVIPQPGMHQNHHRFRKKPQRPTPRTPKFKEQNKRYQYGNYMRYYGYRNPNHVFDPRLKLFESRPNIFEGKDVLDIGCNNGQVTLCIARDFGAKSVVGLDIDRALIDSARASIRRFASNESKAFPKSMPLLFGSLDVPGVSRGNAFPHNVSFVQGNYVVENDILLDMEQPQFDVILCLSVTKWFQLNWGDTGLKRAFARMFAQLRPGGVLILEPQAYSSYKKKKNLTETIWNNYNSIKLFPTMFTEHLLSEVGFSKCEVLGSPNHPSKGFQRAIRIFTKGETPVSSRTPAAESSTASRTPAESRLEETTVIEAIQSPDREDDVTPSDATEVNCDEMEVVKSTGDNSRKEESPPQSDPPPLGS